MVKEQPKRRIAIFLTRDAYDEYNDYAPVIEKLTDFAEVTSEELNILNNASRTGNFKIIEVPLNTQEFVATTVAEYLEKAKKRAEEIKAAEEKARKKREADRAKSKAAQEAKERKQLEELQAKYGSSAGPIVNK